MICKKKDDIIFIDPKTGEKCCSFNECIKKFVPKTEEADYHTTATRNYLGHETQHTITRHFHECTECGRKVHGKSDRTKSYATKKEK